MQSPISESHGSSLPAPQISIHQHHGSLAKVIILHPVHGEEILDSKRRPFKQRKQRNNSSPQRTQGGPQKTTTANVVNQGHFHWATDHLGKGCFICTNHFHQKKVVLQGFCRGHQGHGLYKFPPTSCSRTSRLAVTKLRPNRIQWICPSWWL